ncbi:MAG: hypothetical protein V9G63_13530 [Candidatus Competibacter sp.]
MFGNPFQAKVMLRFILLLTTAFLVGEHTMSQSRETALNLKWEWPGDRTPDYRILVRVDRLAQPDQGLFGWKKSPSLASALPDPIELTGTVIAGQQDWLGKTITLSLPKLELASAGEGDRVAMGVLIQNVCICIAKAPDPLPGDAERWLASWRCNAS